MIDVEKEVDRKVELRLKEFKRQLNGLVKDNQEMALRLIKLCKEMDKCEHCNNPVRKVKISDL